MDTKEEKPTGLLECIHSCHLGPAMTLYNKGAILGRGDVNHKYAVKSPLFEKVTAERLAAINAEAAAKLAAATAQPKPDGEKPAEE